MNILLPPNPHATGVLVLTAIALILFSRSKISLETSSLVILVILAAGFELFPFAAGGGTIHAVDFFTEYESELAWWLKPRQRYGSCVLLKSDDGIPGAFKRRDIKGGLVLKRDVVLGSKRCFVYLACQFV